MSHSIDFHMVKAIADFAIFLEFSDEKLLNADASMEAMEQLAAELQLMGDKERGDLTQQLKKISAGYGELRKVEFVENLPESLGLE
jgi:hypothetical protein